MEFVKHEFGSSWIWSILNFVHLGHGKIEQIWTWSNFDLVKLTWPNIDLVKLGLDETCTWLSLDLVQLTLGHTWT